MSHDGARREVHIGDHILVVDDQMLTSLDPATQQISGKTQRLDH